jgi:hypothetical protein
MPRILDKHRYAQQPVYDNFEKIKSREQIVQSYRDITGIFSIPKERGYWTFCRDQPNEDWAEIVQLVKCGLIDKSQFFGVDYDIKNEGFIEKNKENHPEANWFKGEWLQVIRDNYDRFNPALVFFDYTKTIATTACHIYLAKTMNMCPAGTVVAANLMLSDGHSSKRFDPNFLIENLGQHLLSDSDWQLKEKYYAYKGSQTEMGTYIFWRKNV